jgi:FeS assembly SUF system protein
MMGREAVASKEMLEEALGDEMEEMARPPFADVPEAHELWPAIEAAIREVYDPEIPVNLYELGLIYRVDIDKDNNVAVKMSLTAPGCPVAGEMPGMVEDAVRTVEAIGQEKTVSVELVWDPPWNPAMMAETAKLQLNMF